MKKRTLFFLSILFYLICMLFASKIKAQNIGINSNGAIPNNSAMLDIDVSALASKKGLLIPRITAAEKAAMNPLPAPAQGLIVYQTDGIQGFYYNSSTTTIPSWTSVYNSGNNNIWSRTGTSVSLSNSGDFVGIGTSSPSDVLQIANGNVILDNNVYIKDNYSHRYLGTGTSGLELGDPYLQNFKILVPTGSGNGITFATNSSSDQAFFNSLGFLGLGTGSPTERLDVAGKTKTQQLQVTTGATSGYVLTSDASGNASWQSASATLSGWSTTGNTGTTAGTNFLGTTDAKDFVIKTTNSESVRITADGNMGINNSNPRSKLDIVDLGIPNGIRRQAINCIINSWPPASNDTVTGIKSISFNGNNGGSTWGVGIDGSGQVFSEGIGISVGVKGTATNGALAVGVMANAQGSGNVIGVNATARGMVGGSNSYGVYSDVSGSSSANIYGYYTRMLPAAPTTTNAFGINTQIAVLSTTSYGIRSDVSNGLTNYGAYFSSISPAPSTNYGVYATASGGTTNWASYFTGNSYISGNLGIGTTTPTYKLDVTGAGHYTSTVTVGAYTLPATDGTSGQVLKTNGTGVLTWQADAGGPFNDWGLNGNSATTAGTNYIGTPDAIDFVTKTNAIERVRVLSTGEVGIGTATPATKLSVVGTATNSSIPSTTSTGIIRVGIGTNEGLDIGKMGSGSHAAWLQSGYNGTTADPISLQPSGGNVGIGTTSPSEKLTVSGAETTLHGKNAAIGIINTSAPGTGWYLRAGATGTSTPGGGFSIADNSAYRFSIDNVGNIGIATIAPTSALEVNGAIAMKVKPAQVAGTNNPDNTGEIWLYTSGTGTISLPTASTCTSRIYVILNQTGAVRTISSYKDISAAAQTSLANNSALWIASDGTNWQQIK